MLEENLPLPTAQAGREKPSRRSSEIDAFVDRFLSMMCETSRRQIIELLASPKSDQGGPVLERRSTDIARELGLSFPTTSGHLKQLTDIGLLSSRREGNVVFYRISNYLLVKAFHVLMEALDKQFTGYASGSLGPGPQE
jgi:DNA-binding transcriptional ArsR family regulator